MLNNTYVIEVVWYGFAGSVRPRSEGTALTAAYLDRRVGNSRSDAEAGGFIPTDEADRC